MNAEFGRHKTRDELDPPASSATTSVTVTLLVFMAALSLVRFMMPGLVEQVHYSIERGKQRARHEVAVGHLEKDPLAGLSLASELVAERIAPSVVHIDTQRVSDSLNEDERIPQVFHDGEHLRGQGSGVVMTVGGHILTNYHVIDGAAEVTVTLSDDRELPAEVVGVDRVTDLAILRVSAKGLVPAAWGDSEEIKEGAMVWAAGSPFGLNKSLTFGILSAKDRRSYDRGKLRNFLQSDAAVSEGNSGGPLVDSLGQVVGINTAIIGPSYQGVSFAIPGNQAQQVYQRLLTEESVERGWLGVKMGDIPNSRPRISGVFISGLINDRSPAKAAGIQKGDIITHWDGQPVGSREDLTSLIAQAEVSEKVEIEVMRAGDRKKLRVKVGPRPLQF